MVLNKNTSPKGRLGTRKMKKKYQMKKPILLVSAPSTNTSRGQKRDHAETHLRNLCRTGTPYPRPRIGHVRCSASVARGSIPGTTVNTTASDAGQTLKKRTASNVRVTHQRDETKQTKRENGPVCV